MGINIWPYAPSAAGALIFVVLFGVTTIWHIVVMFRRKAWYFTPFVIGGLFETVGYVIRYLGARDQDTLIFYILQMLLILVAPALFAASVYMTLGRLIVLLRGESFSPIRPSLLTKLFVGGDILSFLIQIAGSSFLSNNFSLGKTVIIVGLAVQLLSFGLFLVGAATFHHRFAANPTTTSAMLDGRNRMTWKGVMMTLYITGSVIFLRSLLRLVEFTGGNNSPMMTSEIYIYLCDSLMMFIVMAVLAVFHPTQYVRSKRLSQEEGSELL